MVPFWKEALEMVLDVEPGEQFTPLTGGDGEADLGRRGRIENP